MAAAKGDRNGSRRLVQDLQKQGFTVEPTRSGHYKVKAPDGRGLVTVGGTMSSRGLNNTVSMLKRIGYKP